MEISGKGFPAKDVITISLSKTGQLDQFEGMYGSGLSDEQGKFRMTVQIKYDGLGNLLQAGTIWLVALSSDNTVKAGAELQLLPGFSPNLTLNPNSGSIGAKIKVAGTGFPPNTTLFVFSGPPRGDATTKHANPVTNGQGEFEVEIIVEKPAENSLLGTSDSVIVVYDANFAAKAVATFTVINSTDYTLLVIL